MANCPQGMYESNGQCYPTSTVYQDGGLLEGPSHEQGGVPARLQNGGQVELEGGEYIINAQTVNAVGTEYLDKLNSTATTYHQGGFQQGQLGHGSNYRKGGKIRKYQNGGQTRCPVGMVLMNGTCVASPTSRIGRMNTGTGGGMSSGGYKRGGKVRKFQQGGPVNNPIIRKFQAKENLYQYETGVPVPVGVPLHEHRDGTVMTKHSMGERDNSVIVTRTSISDTGNNPMNNNHMSNAMYKKGGKVVRRKKMQTGGMVVNSGNNGTSTRTTPRGVSKDNKLKRRLKKQSRKMRRRLGSGTHASRKRTETQQAVLNKRLLNKKKSQNRQLRQRLNSGATRANDGLRGVTSTGQPLVNRTPAIGEHRSPIGDDNGI